MGNLVPAYTLSRISLLEQQKRLPPPKKTKQTSKQKTKKRVTAPVLKATDDYRNWTLFLAYSTSVVRLYGRELRRASGYFVQKGVRFVRPRFREASVSHNHHPLASAMVCVCVWPHRDTVPSQLP